MAEVSAEIVQLNLELREAQQEKDERYELLKKLLKEYRDSK